MCLNPCCNGIWSRSGMETMIFPCDSEVLILVVMEYGLGEQALFTVLKPLTNRCFQSPRPYRINIFGEVFNTSVKISLLQR